MPVLSSSLLRLALNDSAPLCLRCAKRLATRRLPQSRRSLSAVPSQRQSVAAQVDSRYFLANGFRDGTIEKSGDSKKGWMGYRGPKVESDPARVDGSAASTAAVEDAPTAPATHTDILTPGKTPTAALPRRRGRLKSSSTTSAVAEGALPELPQDASSTLSTLASSAPPLSMRRKLAAYLALTKPRLAFLIVLTTTASYSLYPVPSLLSASATHTPSLSTLTLLFLTTGTFSTIASANTLNMLLEPAHDAKMSRTRNRPLVRGLIRPRAAMVFAVATAVLGTGILWYGVNPTTAVLGGTNIALYAFAYTPLKRISVINTWVGAVVGAIPPLMGWCAAGGHYISLPTATTTPQAQSSSSVLDNLLQESRQLLFSDAAVGGWLLAALLFAWQFPHFNALSHPIRHEYAQAGYKMCVSLHPALNTRVALRYSACMFPVCAGLSYYNVTDKGFVVTSSVVNGWVLRESWRFWRSGGGESKEAAKAARGLFWATVWHLPIVLVLAMAHKKGLWQGVWRSITGDGEEEMLEEEWEDE